MEGLGLGLALGLALGLSIGLLTGYVDHTRKKIERQLRKALVDKKISITDKKGNSLTVARLFLLLEQKYKRI